MCTIKSIICHNLPYYQIMLIGLEKEGITIYFGNGKSLSIGMCYTLKFVGNNALRFLCFGTSFIIIIIKTLISAI